MHFKLTTFFVLRLLFFFFFSSASPSLPSETGRPASSPAATHTSHRPVSKGCVFQPGSKIVDLGFVKFKSNGIKATLRTNPENTGSKKKAIFFVLLGGFAWIFSEIKQG